MGIVYLLHKENFNYVQDVNDQFLLKSILSEDEAKDVIGIQEIIKKEIEEKTNLLELATLTIDNGLRSRGLIFCLSIFENRVIGYGYGHYDASQNNVFYLNTIGVHPDYRNMGIGTGIKIKLIRHVFENSNTELVKAITQPSNLLTIHINENLGFRRM